MATAYSFQIPVTDTGIAKRHIDRAPGTPIRMADGPRAGEQVGVVTSAVRTGNIIYCTASMDDVAVRFAGVLSGEITQGSITLFVSGVDTNALPATPSF